MDEDYIFHLKDTRSETIEEVSAKAKYYLDNLAQPDLDEEYRERIPDDIKLFTKIIYDMTDEEFWEREDKIAKEYLTQKIEDLSTRLANNTVSDEDKPKTINNFAEYRQKLLDLYTDPEKKSTISVIKEQHSLNLSKYDRLYEFARAAAEVKAAEIEDEEDTETDEEVVRKKQKRAISKPAIEENVIQQEEPPMQQQTPPLTQDLSKEAMVIIMQVAKEVEESLPPKGRKPSSYDLHLQTIKNFYEINGFGFSNVKSTEQLLQASVKREDLKQTVYNWAINKMNPKAVPVPPTIKPIQKATPPKQPIVKPPPVKPPNKKWTTPRFKPVSVEFDFSLGPKERLEKYVMEVAKALNNERRWDKNLELLEINAKFIWGHYTGFTIDRVTDEEIFKAATSEKKLNLFQYGLITWAENRLIQWQTSSLCLRCQKKC